MAVTLTIGFDKPAATMRIAYTDHGNDTAWTADIAEDSDEATVLLDAIDAVWRESDDPDS